MAESFDLFRELDLRMKIGCSSKVHNLREVILALNGIGKLWRESRKYTTIFFFFYLEEDYKSCVEKLKI